jgi:CRISPR-associated protein Csh2
MKKANNRKQSKNGNTDNTFQVDILFLYESVKANPNGDPYENKPRIDPWTSHCLVSDVRIKRTIRDFWKRNVSEIFVRREEFGEAKTAGDRLKEKYRDLSKFLKNYTNAKSTLCKDFIDARMFGVTIPIRSNKKRNKGTDVTGQKEKTRDALTVTGPVQFQYGESLHPVEYFDDRGTSAFASKEERGQGTFRASYFVPYALIAVDGTVNAAVSGETGVTVKDLDLLYKGLWHGTIELSTRSKNQRPVALVAVHYNDKEFRIGTLSQFLKVPVKPVKDWMAIRGMKESGLDLAGLFKAIENESKRIEKVEYLFAGDWQPPKNGLWREIRFNSNG